jgi:hypothetical protein
MAEKETTSLKLANIENAFDALMQGDASKLREQIKDVPIGTAQGANVYRQTSLSALVNALSETFSTCRHILGDDYFNQCATSYCQLYPMVHHDLNLYGADFTAYMLELTETRPELAELKFLTDLSRLEWALNEAFFAKKRTPFDLEAFASLDDDERGKLILRLSPDVQLLHTQSNVKDIHEFHLSEENIANDLSFDVTEGDYYYLIQRGTAETNFKLIIEPIERYDFDLLNAIKDETNFINLCESFARTLDDNLEPPPLGYYISKEIIDNFDVC